MVRKTGIFKLPSGQTLRDYTHFAPAMSGALVGYVDLGDINGYLCDYEQQITQGTGTLKLRPVAKTVAVFMVRGLFSKLQFPYAVFPSPSIKGSDLFPLLWEAVGRLTPNDFVVFAVVADGCKSNRKLFQLHSNDSQSL